MDLLNILIIDSGISHHRELKNVDIRAVGFNNQSSLKDIEDSTGHGTAIASLIAKNLSPNRFCLSILKLFNDEYECDIAELIKALEYVADNNCFDIINMSFGITDYQNPQNIHDLEHLCNLLSAQGSILVSAFDNDGAISYPAYFKSVIGVDKSFAARRRTDYEYLLGSIVNINAYGINQRVAWKEPEYTFLSGSSFACANVSNIIAEKLLKGCSPIKIHQELQQNAKVLQFREAAPLPSAPGWLKNAKAIILPLNKEIVSLLAFEELLNFNIVGVYDFKYNMRIGKTVKEAFSHIKKASHVASQIIMKYEEIDWTSNDFDTVVAGHLSEISWRAKRDILAELIMRCKSNNKKLYAFDDLSQVQGVSKCDASFLAYPYISPKHVPAGRMGKLHVILSPVLAVVGTSSRQGKYTLQLSLRQKFIENGYRVGQIGSEPSALCFGMDYVFPYGYQSTVNINGYERILLLNEMMHQIDMREVDICIIGAQSNSISYGSVNLSNIPLHQMEFLLGTDPDAFILCVNPHDDLSYIKRTILALESTYNSQCLATVVFPIQYKQILGGLFKPEEISATEDYKRFVSAVERETKRPSISMNDAIVTDSLFHVITKYFTNPDEMTVFTDN